MSGEVCPGRIRGEQCLGNGKELGEHRERDGLKSQQNESSGVQHSVNVENYAAHRARRGQQPQSQQSADSHEGETGIEKQPARAVEQEETQRTPAIAPGSRCGGRLRPSGDRVVGTSAIRSFNRVALTIISVANSMPVVRSTRRS